MRGLFHVKNTHFLSARTSCRLRDFLRKCRHKLLCATREDRERLFGQTADPTITALVGCGGRVHNTLDGCSCENEGLNSRDECRPGAFRGGGGRGRTFALLGRILLAYRRRGRRGGLPLPTARAFRIGLWFSLTLGFGLSSHRARRLLLLSRHCPCSRETSRRSKFTCAEARRQRQVGSYCFAQ